MDEFNCSEQRLFLDKMPCSYDKNKERTKKFLIEPRTNVEADRAVQTQAASGLKSHV